MRSDSNIVPSKRLREAVETNLPPVGPAHGCGVGRLAWRAPLLLTLVLICATGLAGSRTQAADKPVQGAREVDLKAGFVVAFARYVHWPESAFATTNSPIIITVLGDDPLREALDVNAAGKTARGRPYEIRRAKVLEEVKETHMLFVAASEKGRARQILSAMKGRAVLLVGDHEGFLEAGGHLQFLASTQYVRFGVNLDQVRSVDLRLDSKLTDLARVIISDGKKQTR